MDDRKAPRRKQFGAWMARWPTAAQIAGGAAALIGVGQLLGGPAALVIGGVVLAAAGTLREAKLI